MFPNYLLSNFNSTSDETQHEGWICPSKTWKAPISMARNLKGNWNIIVNIKDDPKFTQVSKLSLFGHME